MADSPGVTQSHELESIYVRLWAKVDDSFTNLAGMVAGEVDRVNASLSHIGQPFEGLIHNLATLTGGMVGELKGTALEVAGSVAAINTSLQGLAQAPAVKSVDLTALESLTVAVGNAHKSVVGLSSLDLKGLGALTDALSYMGMVDVKGLEGIALSLDYMAPALRAMSAVDGKSLGHMVDGLDKFSVQAAKLSAVDPTGIGNLGLALATFSRADSAAVSDLGVALGTLNASVMQLPTSAISGLQQLTAPIQGLAGIDPDKLTVLSGALARVGSFLSAVTKADLPKIGQTVPHLEGFGRQFAAISTSLSSGLGPMKQVSLTLQRVGQFLNSIRKFDPIQFAGATASLTKPIQDMVASLATVDVSAAEPVIGALSKVGGLVRSFSKFDVGGMEAFTKALTPLGDVLRSLGTGGSEKLVASFHGLAGLIRSLPKFDSFAMEALGQGMVRLFKGLAAVPEDTVLRVGAMGKAMSGMGNLVKALPKFDSFAMEAFSQGAGRLFRNLGSVPDDAVKRLTSLGNASRGLASYMKAAGAGGAELPPVINRISVAADGAGPPVKSLANRFRDMAGGLRSGAAGMTYMQLSMGALAAFGTSMFAKLDDGLTRVMANLRDWNRMTQGMLEAGTLDISSRSRTGALDLAKGLEVLTSNGMNASMALESLRTAETFAVAGHMQMEEATRKLVDVQNRFGLTVASGTERIQENYANMRHVSDVIVGLGPLVGSTATQMSDALGNKLATAARMMGVSFDQAAVLVGTYSLRGIRGSEASDLAGRALLELGRRSADNIWRWKALGVNVYDTTGKFRDVSDIMGDLSTRFEGMSHIQRIVTLELMGFENRALNAILPLVGMADAMKTLKTEIANVGGLSELRKAMMNEDFMGQFLILKNNVMGMAVAVGKVLAPAVAYLARGIESLTRWFTGLNPAVRAFVTWATIAAVTLGPLLGLLGTIGSMTFGPIMTFVSVMMSLATTVLPYVLIGLLALPAVLAGLLFFGPLIASVLGLVVSYLAWFNMKVAEGLKNFWEGLGADQFKAVLTVIESFFGALLRKSDFTFGSMGQGVGRFALAAQVALEGIAGFFWNFADNMNRIFSWIGRNWKDLLIDMVTASLTLTINILFNLSKIGDFISKSAYDVWGGFMVAGMGVFEGLFAWLRLNWKKIDADISLIFGNLFRNLARIVGTWVWGEVEVMKNTIIRGVAGAAVQMSLMVPGLVSPAQAAVARTVLAGGLPTDAQVRARADASRPGMFDGIRQQDFQTDLGGLVTFMSQVARTQGDFLRDLFGNVGDDFHVMIDALRPLLQGFRPKTTEELELNLALPSTAMDKLIEKMSTLFKPAEPVPEEAGQMSGKGGPGFVFKQISLERTMIGGPVAEQLDYQQLVTLRMIENRLTTQIDIQRGIQTALGGQNQGGPFWVPAVLGR